MNRICIDVTNISPGKGGAGGGIATYAKNLLLGLDVLLENSEPPDLEIFALGHPDFLKNIPLDRIQIVHRTVNNQSIFWRNYWLHITLPQFLKRHEISVLHRVIPELPMSKTCKYVMTLHDFMFDFYLENPVLNSYLGRLNHLKFLFLRSLMRSGVASHDAILVPSSSIAEEARKRFSSSNLNIRVTKLATNRVPIDQPSNEPINPEIKLGYVAGFYPHKGHKQAIHLMKKLRQLPRGKMVKLFLRGSVVYQNYYQEMLALIRDEGLSEVVFLEGFDPAISIEEIYQNYTATLLLSEYEGFGLPVLESQSFAKPVICSDIPVFRENLKNSAIYLNQNPTIEEAEVLLDKLFDQEYLDGLVAKGRENVSNYSWENTCRETFESYLELL